MDGMIYVSTSGAHQYLQAQTVYSNNLANANTTGFKQDKIRFSSQPVATSLGTTRVYSYLQSTETDFSPGDNIPTNRDMDIAINGEQGWFAVQDANGNEAYTRSGSLYINQDGLLMTLKNLPVVGEGGQILIPPYQKLDIGNDGTITILPLGGNNPQPLIIDKIKLVNPDVTNLVKGEDGLIRLKQAQTLDPDETIQIATGYLEGSNVNAIDALTHMVSLARQFELQMKLIEAAAEKEQANASTLALS